MNRIILTGTILDYPDRKGLCLKYSFRPDGMEESIILAIKCQSEEAKEKVIDMLDADTKLIITGSLKAENDNPIIELTDFYFLQTYNGGKISKLFIQESNKNILACYDRGWDIKPHAEAKEILEKILEAYN